MTENKTSVGFPKGLIVKLAGISDELCTRERLKEIFYECGEIQYIDFGRGGDMAHLRFGVVGDARRAAEFGKSMPDEIKLLGNVVVTHLEGEEELAYHRHIKKCMEERQQAIKNKKKVSLARPSPKGSLRNHGKSAGATGHDKKNIPPREGKAAVCRPCGGEEKAPTPPTDDGADTKEDGEPQQPAPKKQKTKIGYAMRLKLAQKSFMTCAQLKGFHGGFF
eukprot:jgi/Bigna1/138013/aug1.42_g12721